jgi:hypothetical protein
MLIVVMLSVAMLSVKAQVRSLQIFLTWDQCYKTLLSVIYHFRTKLECFLDKARKAYQGPTL